MYTKEEIELFFSEHNIVLLSIESTPRKNKYNREVKVTVRCCVDGCQETVTKCFRNYTISKNFGCKDHCLALKTQKYKETQKQNKMEKSTGFEETKGETDTDEHSHNDALVVVNTDTVLVDDKDQAIIDTLQLTEDLKTQFLKNHYFFEYNGQAWTKANNVARFLEFKEARYVIYSHVSKSDKIAFKHFPDTVQKAIISGIRFSKTDHQKPIHPETMFINDEGVFDLFMKSHKPIAKAMKRWLVYEVIPSIIKTGTYSIFPMPIAQTAIQEAAVAIADPRSTTCHNPNSFPISSMKSAIYILQLPLLNMYKFGYSTNLINRFKQHEYDFGEISIELILEAPDIQEIEKRLKTEIRSHGINTVFEIDGKKLKELFDPAHLNKVCEIAHEIVDNYNSDSFTNSQNHEYRMACELLKQKQKDIELKEKDIEMKDKDIEMKDKDIKLAMELCKQKQYDIDILKLRIELIQTTRKRKAET